MTLFDAFTALACELSQRVLRRHLKYTTGFAANDNGEVAA